MNKQVKKYSCTTKQLGCILPTKDDRLLILFASYEDRCHAVIDCFEKEYKAENTVIFYNKEFMDRGNTKKNLNIILKRAHKISKKVDVVASTLSQPNNFIRVIHDYITKASVSLEDHPITIDISTFPRQELLLMLRYIKMLNPRGVTRILYTKPKKYGDWLSKGFKEVITVPSFAGTQIPGRKKLLIIMAGFEEERMLQLWEEHEPSKTILIIGNPPTSKEFLKINKIKSKMILNRFNVISEEAPADDPFKFRDALADILNKYKRDFNIFIAPMNTKIQTVGLFLLSEKYNWFQITLAVPNDYNVVGYSVGAQEIYEFKINFAELSQ